MRTRHGLAAASNWSPLWGLQRCGGLPQVILAICRGIDSTQVQQTIFLLRRHPEEVEPDLSGIPVIPARWSSSLCEPFQKVPSQRLRAAFGRVWITWKILGSGIDILHIHRGVDSHRWIAACCRGFGIRVIRTIHADPAAKSQNLLRSVARLLNIATNMWVALSDRHATVLHEVYGVQWKSIQVVPNGIDLEAYARAASRRDSMRASLDAREDFVLLSAARLDLREKDFPCLLRAVAIVRNEIKNVRLLIAGEGSGRCTIDTLIQEFDLKDRVQLLGHRADMPDLMAAADALVFATYHEGMPLTALEALAAGLPVIGTDVSGLREVCADGRAGLLVGATDADALARAILRVARDSNLRNALIACGKERARREYSRELMVRRYQTVYLDMMGRHRLEGAEIADDLSDSR